ncbi:hypothetical protein SK128_011768, partial [Halocaridina rubra]
MTWLREEVLGWVPNAVTYVTLTALIGFFIAWYLKRMQKVALIEKIPGPRALPLLGNALEVNVDPRELFQRARALANGVRGELTRIWLGPLPMVVATTCGQAE